MRKGCGVEVAFADSPRSGGADDEACSDACEGEYEGFQQEHAHQCALRAAEGFHKGEVATAFEHRCGERGEDADGDGEGDEQDGSEHEGVGAIDDA